MGPVAPLLRLPSWRDTQSHGRDRL
jgi:hypothetical protein